ncbi:MAG: hypothetical protein R3B09_35610 [Nannocystaceae bacterium]
MRGSTTLAWIAAAGLLAGCDPADEASPDDATSGEASTDDETSAWIEVAAARFEEDGESETLTLPPLGSVDALALRATTDPGVCFQLSSAVDGEGRAVILGRSAGVLYCRACALRTSIAAAAGVLVLPREAGQFEPETGLSLRFARVACDTLTPLKAPEDRPSLRIDAQPIVRAPAPATLDLRFLIAGSSILASDDARQQALLDALTDELASAGVVPRLVDARAIDDLPDAIRFHNGDPGALAAAIAAAPAKDERTVDVVFGGCLLYDDPIFGPPSPVNGFTPRIPGGAGPADGVYMPGVDCFAVGDAGPLDLPVGAQAHVLAHELGHYLGLYHAVEEDGTTDRLDDTGPDNIMHFNPQRAASVGFSPAQGEVMRTHPALRPR